MNFAHGFQQLQDAADNRFPLSKVLGSSKPKVMSRFHKPGIVMNQGSLPHCVGFSCQQLLQSEPVPQKGLTGSAIYREAKKIDEFGPRVGGTSIRAGMNVLKAKKLIDAYFWAKNSEQVIDYLLRYGPVVAGTPWYSGMNRTDRNGLVKISGKSEGGHAWLIVGANQRTGLIHAINSWGMEYGIAGQFSLTFKDFDTLMQRGGVAAAAIEPGTKL
jgi:hypothetical protein